MTQPCHCGKSATALCDGSCEAPGVIRETPDLVRVYRPEWVQVFSSTAVGENGYQECHTHCDEVYQGRVMPYDMWVRRLDKKNPDTTRSVLMLKLPVLKGEFKTEDLAGAWVREQPWAVEVGVVTVVRNSKADHDIRQYGKRMLLAATTADGEERPPAV